MSTQIISPLYISDVSDISQLTQKIRRYKKSALTEQGINILWNIYKNPHSVSEEDRKLLMSYGPRIILIGLATANEHRNKLATSQDFYFLCCDYLNLKDSIADKQFLENEAEEIINELYKIAEKKYKIPTQYIEAGDINFTCEVLFLERIKVSQDYRASIGIEQLYFAWEVFSKLDKILNGLQTETIKKIFKIEPLHFMRSAFGLFMLALQKNGKINFKEEINCDENFLGKWNIDLETCRLVASKIAYDESKLREWHTEILSLNPFYQKYHPNLLLSSPIIHKDTHPDGQGMVCLMPSPTYFLSTFTDLIFSNLCQNDQQNDIMSTMGKRVLEPYIENALKCMFGNQNVHNISEEGNDKKTDFYVQHAKCDLIFEIKTSIAGYQAQALMAPKHITDIWGRLYNATKQCAASLEKYKSANKPIIPIIIVTDASGNNATAFQMFAERTGIFKDLGIDCIEFFTWSDLEYYLSKTSVDNFIEALLEKWKSGKNLKLEDINHLPLIPDTPAHKYQYLEKAKLEFFGEVDFLKD